MPNLFLNHVLLISVYATSI